MTRSWASTRSAARPARGCAQRRVLETGGCALLSRNGSARWGTAWLLLFVFQW